MNPSPINPLTPGTQTTASPTDTSCPPSNSGSRPPRSPAVRRVCYLLVGLAVLVLGYFEIGKPTLSDDPILQPLMTMTVTRLVGAAVFLVILLYEGYRVLHPFRKPFLRSLAFVIPAFLVVVNNMPILSMLWGDAYFRPEVLEHMGLYMTWLVLESLAIGLFEELAFRGVILLAFAERRRATRTDLFVCILLTSAVFGLIHLVNLIAGAGVGAVIRQIGYSFLIGAMCSVVLYKTANIWLCVLLHAVYDFCGNLMPTLGAGSWWDVPTVVFTVLLAVAVTVYMVVALWRLKPTELDRIFD